MAAPTPKPNFFASAAAFRKWLERNHATRQELWVGYWKKDAARKGITYAEAVEEALCFGWIDGLAKGIDGERYMQRFTPRRPGSIWSAINLKKVEQLKAEGRMAKAGLEAVERRDPKRTGIYSFENPEVDFAPAFEKRFRKERTAWAFFNAQPPGYRRLMKYRVMSAKREATRESRFARLVEASAAGKRL